MVLSVIGAVPQIAFAQTPANWPQGAPLVGTGTEQMTMPEIEYFGRSLDAALANASKTGLTQAQAGIYRSALDNCLDEDGCTPAQRGIVRDNYIKVVTDNVAAGVSVSTEGLSPPTPPTGPEDPTDPVTPPPDGEDVPDGVGGEVENIPPGPDSSCNLVNGNLLLCIGDIAAKVVALLAWVFTTLFAWMLGVVGSFLNWVMLVTVFHYATYFGNSQGLLIAWSILRDLGNILLLFGFIFIGLQTILNIGHFSVGKALARLVIFAILINFSLFVSSAIVDVSNVFAATMYDVASEGDCRTAGATDSCVGYGIAGKVLEASGMSDIFRIRDSANQLGAIITGDGYRALAMHGGMAIFMVIMTITLGAAAIMFVIRAIVLMILLVLSPLGFAGMALPQFEEQSGKWWKMLISQSFFAPLYILFILVGLKIMEGARATFNSGDANLTDALMSSNTSTGGIFLIFALMIGFMIAAMQLAKNMGAVGASFAVNTATGATAGTIGFVGRRTVGGAANWAAQKAEKSAWLQKRPGLSRMVLAGTDAMTHSSFDLRQSGVAKSAFKSAGYSLGGPNKTAAHGLHGIHEKADKDREKWEKRQKKTDAAATMGEEAQHELDHLEEERENELGGKKKEIRDQAAKIAKLRKQKVDETILHGEQEQLNRLEKEYKKMEGDWLKESSGLSGQNVKAKGKPFKKDLTRGERIEYLKERKKEWNKLGDAEKNRAMIEGYEHSANNWIMQPTMGPHADHEAVGRIRKNAGMDSTTKALEDLKASLKTGTGEIADAIHDEGHKESKRDDAAAEHAADHGHA